MQLLSASDGWVIIDPDSSAASTFSKNGAPPARTQFQNSWKLSSDKRTLTIRGRSASSEIGAVFMIDMASKTPMDPLPITSRSAFITVWRQDFIVAIGGSTLVGYAPES